MVLDQKHQIISHWVKLPATQPLTLPRDTATAISVSDAVSWVMDGLAGLGTLIPDNLMQRVKEPENLYLE